MNSESKEGKPKIRVPLSPRERELLVKFFEEDQSRPEYVEGKLKLSFEHQFSDGTVFRAAETEDGIARFELFRDGRPVFDFASLLPEGHTFLTPTGLKRRFAEDSEELQEFFGEWARVEEDRLISIGDFKKVTDIFGLLHEIGHSHQEGLRHAVEDVTEPEPGMTLEETIWKRYIMQNSHAERDAWARAFRMARKIKQETGTNLFEVLQAPEDLQRMVYLPLISHRFEDENALAEALEGEKISSAFQAFIGEELHRLAEAIEKERGMALPPRKAHRLYEKGRKLDWNENQD